MVGHSKPMTSGNAVLGLLAVMPVLATCSDQAGMMDADLPEQSATGAAIDRAPQATSLNDDLRYDLVIATLGKLLAEHPNASGGRIDLDRVFGSAYELETLTYRGHSFERVPRDARVEPDTYTITLRDLKLTATNEATLIVGMLYADKEGDVEDHIYEAMLVRGGDGVWTAKLTYRGHFDGELAESG